MKKGSAATQSPRNPSEEIVQDAVKEFHGLF